ncbi:hypothetical protein ACVIWU_000505 [Bradyrhizobium sp. USDA 4509]|uniref:hypothetical protein n=1 Tax=Bradyrhizobium brasilense TaxID=1419277 RepID=UPI0019D3694F|nr:hypothetical protein [Bradyrhizobium brasilense]
MQRLEQELSSYAAFASALVKPERAPPAVVCGPRRKAAVKRYNVYRNNITVSLIKCVGRCLSRQSNALPGSNSSARWRAITSAPHRRPHRCYSEYGRDFPALIVEFSVPDGWPIHVTWAAMALGIMPGDLGAFRRIIWFAASSGFPRVFVRD